MAPRMRRLWQVALGCAALLGGVVRPARALDIWFAPPDDMPRGKLIMNEDFYQLFVPGTGWPKAASRISVFSLNTTFAEMGSEERLRTVAAWLAAHNIKLNVTLQAVFTQGCGQGVEGMVQVDHQPGDIARRLKSLGISVASFSFDGPLGFGHIYTGKNACRYSVREVAHRLAHTVADVRTSYPNAKFIDYEGPTDLPLAQWVPTLHEWLDAYHTDTETELDGLSMDANWRLAWRKAAVATVEILHAHNVKAGIFVDASGGPNVTDESWMKEAKLHVSEVRATALDLDFVIIASWMLHPWRLLPETDPLTLTSLVNFY